MAITYTCSPVLGSKRKTELGKRTLGDLSWGRWVGACALTPCAVSHKSLPKRAVSCLSEPAFCMGLRDHVRDNANPMSVQRALAVPVLDCCAKVFGRWMRSLDSSLAARQIKILKKTSRTVVGIVTRLSSAATLAQTSFGPALSQKAALSLGTTPPPVMCYAFLQNPPPREALLNSPPACRLVWQAAAPLARAAGSPSTRATPRPHSSL